MTKCVKVKCKSVKKIKLFCSKMFTKNHLKTRKCYELMGQNERKKKML